MQFLCQALRIWLDILDFENACRHDVLSAVVTRKGRDVHLSSPRRDAFSTAGCDGIHFRVNDSTELGEVVDTTASELALHDFAVRARGLRCQSVNDVFDDFLDRNFVRILAENVIALVLRTRPVRPASIFRYVVRTSCEQFTMW